MGVFLEARWRNLILLTFAVPAEMLLRRLPAGCELDLWDGRAHVSLVAFDFLETRVFGVGWPGLRNFPEINLRFYVKCGGKRGVCFVREFVPSRVVAMMARRIYNEPYVAAKMRSVVEERGGELRVRHGLHFGGRENRAEVVADAAGVVPGEGTAEHFFKEHQWGFGRQKNGGALCYEVRHPVWEIFAVKRWELDWDWGAVYGGEWGFLGGKAPVNVMLAAGSEVSVMRWRE